MATLYADENVPQPLVEALFLLGHDVLTALADGRANQNIADPDVLARAVALGWAMLSNNWWDFIRLHRQSAGHAGIVVYTDDPDYAALAGRINAGIAGLPSLVSELVRIYCPNPPAP
jgi:DNA-binding NarL/FixJ family response regulator